MSVPYRVGYVVEGTEPLAVFLDSGPQAGHGRLTVYARLGEHAEADIDYLRGLPRATPAHYADLHTYLTRRHAGNPLVPLPLTIDQTGVPR